MNDKKPNVFPNMDNSLNNDENKTNLSGVSQKEIDAANEMAERTKEQLRLREERLNNSNNTKIVPHIPIEPVNIVDNKVNILDDISRPNMNQPYDVLPLPSGGKLYKNKESKVKVAYLTASDENILTSPNLINSGDFLEVLINRKLLNENLRYKDLIPGDRDAIMIWLRATGYGDDYDVTIYDEDGEPFEVTVKLSELKIKNLNVEPDDEGFFNFNLPISGVNLKFKLLTIGEIDELDKLSEFLKEKNIINTDVTLVLSNQIVEIDGFRDRKYIEEFVDNMRVGDSKALRDYISKIECGVDLNLTFRTPGGGSVTRFLPFTTKFFWPDFEL